MRKNTLDSYFTRRPSKAPRVEPEEGGSSNAPRVEPEEGGSSNAPRVEPEIVRPSIATCVESQEVGLPEASRVLSEEAGPSGTRRVDSQEVDTSLVWDPGLRKQIWDYPSSQRDEIRRAYIIAGPCQPKPPTNQHFLHDKNHRCFQESWYKSFPNWLEYYEFKNRAFCLPCFLFTKPSQRPGASVFMVGGFSSWKKVNDGQNCALLSHVGKGPNSIHRVAIGCCYSLMKQKQHIENIVEKQTSKQIASTRLRLGTTTDVVRYLTLQGSALRGRDESKTSNNRGNLLEMIKLLASYNKDVDATVLDNAPKNCTYTSPTTQRQILTVLSDKIRKFIRGEISDEKFCIIVDEARDESKRENMAIVLRFVDKHGLVREHFFDIVHVKDTMSATLKEAICKVLSRHELSVQNIRGQGYDGASNMRGEVVGLQALFSIECPFAYYVHCFAHRLQLALIAVAKDSKPIWQFFSHLHVVVNVVGASCKRNDQLRDARAAEIAHLLAINDEFETGSGKNQVTTLKRPGDTRWGSHLGSISSLITLFSATCTVLSQIINDGVTASQRAEADGVYDVITTFEFVFILHLMREIMEITDDLCQALQRKSQDILNAMHLVSSTKTLIQKLRADGWVTFLAKVELFCRDHHILIPDMAGIYMGGRGRGRTQDSLTNGHHFRVEIFMGTIDSQLQELNHRFKEDVMRLLVLSSALDPRNNYRSFKINDICELANNYYPMDFTEQEKFHLRYQLQNYENDILVHSEFQNLSTISKLCQVLVETGKSTIYHLIDRLIRLVLTLPVSTATSERAFSAMRIVKTRLRNRMEDDYLATSLLVFIEKDIARQFDTDSIIDAFDILKKTRRERLQMPDLTT